MGSQLTELAPAGTAVVVVFLRSLRGRRQHSVEHRMTEGTVESSMVNTRTGWRVQSRCERIGVPV